MLTQWSSVPAGFGKGLLVLTIGLNVLGTAVQAQNPPQPIPATAAFNDSPTCSASDLGNNTDLARINPEYKPIIIDPNHPIPNNSPTVLEGIVPPPSENAASTDQAHSEESEEEIPWNHYTHDFTFKVVPDGPYQYLLSSWVNADGTVSVHGDMEVEWENASLMDESEGFQRIWGSVPEFVWPGVGDRIWTEGRWIFDCGHPNASDREHVQYSTEIHPPRALVTFRLNHPALDSFQFDRVSAPSFAGPQSYLPVTGEPTILPPDAPNPGPTRVPVTEADIFVSGNGGGANDICSLTSHDIPFSGDCSNHTGPIIPVNDRNYVFDVYPPGTCYGFFTCQLVNGTFPISPPTPDASLQWRVVDHFSELPAHACGGFDNSVCVTVNPVFCLIDSNTPPPTQTETGCPVVPAARPTRLRVILPFKDSNANFFAQSILLGWDDVPAPPTTPSVRTFKVALNKFTVLLNLSGLSNLTSFSSGDWRVFVNVGGQYRYMSPLFHTDRGNGVYSLDGGDNVCNGDSLTDNGNGDCFQFDNTPWTVSVQDGTPIHVAVGGFAASGSLEDDFCRTFPGGCDFSLVSSSELILYHFERIGTYEFDLLPPMYAPPSPFTTQPIFTETECNGGNCVTIFDGEYAVEFGVNEVPPVAAPTTDPIVIGAPHYGAGGSTFISSATPVSLQTESPDGEGFQYRFHAQGGPLPVYASPQPFPVHWTHADLAPGTHSVAVNLGGVADGPYDFQYSAESFANSLEPRHTAPVILDNTAPLIAINQPQAISYPHSAVLTLGYSADDGTGSGVQNLTALMDGLSSLAGHGLANGQTIHLLTELALGDHTFAVTALDNVNNTRTSTLKFTIIVTADSIRDDVTQFLESGAINNNGIANSLLSKLNSAAAARSRGQCSTAANNYQAFINELQAQSGKHVDAAAAAIMIADAQYLIAHCP